MKISEALVAWTPGKDCQVGPLAKEGVPAWSRPYCMTGGAAFIHVRKAEPWKQVALMFIEFHTLVVRDGIDPAQAHKEFLKIDEYRQRISPDISGAEGEDFFLG
jgi:hypothetical protein